MSRHVNVSGPSAEGEPWLKPMRSLIHQAEKACDSPIEISFLRALLGYWWRPCGTGEIPLDEYPRHRFALKRWNRAMDQEAGLCLIQATIGKHRVDFAFVKGGHRFVVETDGFQFHALTSAQACADRARDRDLVLSDWRVIRFMGSEIWKDANRCAMEVMNIMHYTGLPVWQTSTAKYFETERRVLGFVIGNGLEMMTCLPRLDRNCFTGKHGLLFDAINLLVAEHGCGSFDDVVTALRGRGSLEAVGGERYLNELRGLAREHTGKVEDDARELVNYSIIRWGKR